MNNNTWFYSLSVFFSDYANLNNEEIWVVVRGCNVKDGLIIESGNTGSYQVEEFTVTANHSFTVTEMCRDKGKVCSCVGIWV